MQIKYSLSLSFCFFCLLFPATYKTKKRRGRDDVSGGARFSIEQEGRRKKIREVRKLELTEEAFSFMGEILSMVTW